MTITAAYQQITKGIDDYDEGNISRAALLLIVDESLKSVHQDVWSEGYHAGQNEAEGGDVEFEAEMDLEDFREDCDDDLFEDRDDH